jgi:hypothetical protein
MFLFHAFFVVEVSSYQEATLSQRAVLSPFSGRFTTKELVLSLFPMSLFHHETARCATDLSTPAKFFS